MEVHRIVSGLPGVEAFNYEHPDWLPWRYSFKLPNPEHAQHFTTRARKAGIKVSRLYPPLDSYFPDLQATSALPVARKVGRCIHNLAYETTPRATGRLMQQLKTIEARF
jgi:hypothetical protein